MNEFFRIMFAPDDNGDGGDTGDTGGDGDDNKGTPTDQPDSGDGDEGKKASTTIAGSGQSDDGDSGPEAYTNYELPEGWNMNDEMLSAMTPTLRELGATDEQVQTLISGWVASETAGAEAQEKESKAAYEKEQADWLATIEADPDFGGKNFETTKKNSALAVSTYGDPEVAEWLNTSGRGNWPPFVKMTARLGALLQEDDPHLPTDDGGTGKPKQEASMASKMYAPDGGVLTKT